VVEAVLTHAITRVAETTGLHKGLVQIKYDLRDDGPEGEPPVPWTVEVSLPPKRKGGTRLDVHGYGASPDEAATDAIAAVERHR
jgi:hypothetical protein